MKVTIQALESRKSKLEIISFLSVKHNGLIKITEDFEQKAQKLFSSAVRGTEEYKRCAIILAYAWNSKIELMFRDSERQEEMAKLIKKVMNHLEPFNEDLMGFYPYAFACMNHVCQLKMSSESLSTLTKISAFAIKTWLNPKFNQALNGAQLFDIPVDEQTPDFTMYQETHTSELAIEFITEKSLNNVKSRSDTVKKEQKNISMLIQTASNLLKSSDFIKKMEGIAILQKIAETCLEGLQFKQSLHALSVSMFHFIKLRKCFPADKRSKLNEVLADLSYSYAKYGLTFAAGSVEKMNPHYEQFMVPSSEFIEMTDLIEPGIETYSSQFPTEYVDNPLEIKKIIKKALAWNKRAIELNEGKQQKLEEYETMNEALNQILTMFN